MPYDADAWTQFGFDAQGVRCNPNERALSVRTAPYLIPVWSDKGKQFGSSSPVVSQGVLYVGAAKPAPALLAYNAATGVRLWSQPLANNGQSAQSAPAVADGVVVIGSANVLAAFAAATGSPLWQITFGRIVQGNPVIAGGIVYMSSQDGHLYAMNLANGASVWTAPFGGQLTATTALPSATTGLAISGKLLAVGAGQTLYAFDATTGQPLWSQRAPGGLSNSAPTISDGIMYIGGFDGSFSALDAQTGATLWSATTGSVVNGSAAVGYGLVYVGSGDGVVYAYNAKTGALAWKRSIGGVIFTSPALANGVLYASTACDCGATTAKDLAALDARTGAPLWSFAVGYPLYSSPTVANGSLYASAFTGLFAFSFSG